MAETYGEELERRQAEERAAELAQLPQEPKSQFGSITPQEVRDDDAAAADRARMRDIIDGKK